MLDPLAAAGPRPPAAFAIGRMNRMTWTPFEFDEASPVDLRLPEPDATPIVVVDDEPPVLALLEKVLRREGYPVQAYASPHEALKRISEGGVALLITDIRMPAMSGLELARRALEEDPDLAVLVLTGAADTDTAVESLRLGIEDYLAKPVSVDALVESVGRALRRRSQELYRHKLEAWLRTEVDRRTEQVHRQAEELKRVSVATLSALVRTMEAKDPYLKGHSERVADLCEKMGEVLGFDEEGREELRTAGLLHDIGMIAIHESVTNKNGQLTDEEYDQVKKHVEIAANILQPLTHLGRAVEYVRGHHELLNGSGYPRGLKGDQIPLGAQIVGLAETYVSMTEDRAFRPAYAPAEALETLREGRGIWFEPRVCEALEKVLRGTRAKA
ncbi:MAG: response regulator [Deltaproteobacteria bacterium]|nr:MAG: response regulator [Deltaproteobacteria bacterium]